MNSTAHSPDFRKITGKLRAVRKKRKLESNSHDSQESSLRLEAPCFTTANPCWYIVVGVDLMLESFTLATLQYCSKEHVVD